MRADLLPGRSFWTSESSPVTPTSAAPSTLTSSTAAQPAVSSSGANGKQPARSATQAGPAAALNPNNTLKKLGLRGERGLVIELLGDSQGRVRPPAGSFRVWVQELLNPGAKEVCICIHSIYLIW